MHNGARFKLQKRASKTTQRSWHSGRIWKVGFVRNARELHDFSCKPPHSKFCSFINALKVYLFHQQIHWDIKFPLSWWWPDVVTREGDLFQMRKSERWKFCIAIWRNCRYRRQSILKRILSDWHACVTRRFSNEGCERMKVRDPDRRKCNWAASNCNYAFRALKFGKIANAL